MRHGVAARGPSPTSASVFVSQHAEPESDSHSDDDQDHHDHGTTCSVKRKRPTSVSCELCKQRKVKCDRGQPSCGWCARNGAVCEYKERRRPGLRAGFGKELQKRMDKLEAILQSHSEIIQNLAANPQLNVSGGFRSSNPNLPRDQELPDQALTHLYHPSDSRCTLRGDGGVFASRPSGFLSRSQHAKLTTPRHTDIPENFHNAQTSSSMPMGTSPATSQLQPMKAADAEPQNYYSQHQANSIQSSTGSAPPDQDYMPPYDLLYALVDLYFKHINTWCPILHRKTTLDSLFGPSTLQKADEILLNAIVATTMRYSSDARLTDGRRQHYHRLCKDRVLLYGMENTSVKSLQALVILALDLVGSSNGPPGWNILALITRSVVQLGLAVESNSFSVSPNYTSIYTLRAMILPEPKDFIEDEARRRLFWMIYILDRYATIATAFEFALADKDIDRTLPCRDDLWMQNQRVDTKWFKTREHHGDLPVPEICQPANLGALAYYVEILGILSKIHIFLKQPVDISAPRDVEHWQLRYKEMDSLLTSWRYGLPLDIGNMSKLFGPSSSSRNINCILVMLHATYHTAVIRLHSSAAYPTTRSSIFTPSYSASQRCHGAVEEIAALGQFVVQNGLLTKLGPPFAWTLWVSARLLLVHGSTVEHKLSPQIGFFVDTLHEIGRYWPVATRYSGLLQRVLDEHRHSEQKGDGVTPSSVKILADMRRTAFDLDFLISRQPRRSSIGSMSGGAGGAGGMSAGTPSRTPAPNELEYLDVFDFFNVPRLAFGGETSGAAAQAMTGPDGGGGGMDRPDTRHDTPMASNEFNITNFIMDARSDWLFKQDGGKYMTRV
ncbi:hypothetical protein E4U55_003873 [Claviceps digitariae]|nr:hypothetical protein E4U55_003873 [Claviceps digitariae]